MQSHPNPVADPGIAPGSGGVVPVLRYRDVRAAVTWLENAFGFEQDRLLADEDGSLRYAQLSYGSSMVMLCPVGGSAFDAYMAQPQDQGGCETQVCYVLVADARAHQARAIAAGAEIVLDIDGGEGKGRGYSCRDLEGHIWSFGTYDPWRLVGAQGAAKPLAGVPPASPLRKLAGVMAIIVAAAVSSVGLVSWVHGAADPGIAATLASIDDVIEKPADMESALAMLRQVRTELARERSVRMQAERRGLGGRDRLVAIDEDCAKGQPAGAEPCAKASVYESRAITFTASAPNATAPAPQKIVAVPSGGVSEELAALKRAVAQAEAQLQKERQAREVSALDVQGVREQLTRERVARELAERQALEAARKAARIDAVRRAVYLRRSGGSPYGGASDYRDIAKEIFPTS